MGALSRASILPAILAFAEEENTFWKRIDLFALTRPSANLSPIHAVARNRPDSRGEKGIGVPARRYP